jgi:hypothetical protein
VPLGGGAVVVDVVVVLDVVVVVVGVLVVLLDEEELEDGELLPPVGGGRLPPPPGWGVCCEPLLPGCWVCCGLPAAADEDVVADVSVACVESEPLRTVASCVLPDEVFVELFACVTSGGVDWSAPALDVTAKLATAAQIVATPTPTAASSAYGVRRALPDRSSGSSPSSDSSIRS